MFYELLSLPLKLIKTKSILKKYKLDLRMFLPKKSFLSQKTLYNRYVL